MEVLEHKSDIYSGVENKLAHRNLLDLPESPMKISDLVTHVNMTKSSEIIKYFLKSFKLVGLMAFPSEIRQLTWRVLFPIFDITYLRKN